MIRLRFAGQLALVGLLSFLSGYRWPSLADVNFDIVNMLTPYGLIANLGDPQSPLYPFYFASDPAPAPPWFVLLLLAVLACNGLALLPRLRK